MLCLRAFGPVPDETARVARAALSADHPDLRLADELGTLFNDELFQRFYPTHGQPALSPWRLALVTLRQFAEGLSDRQAVSAIRSRIDWKYVLRLELDEPGFAASVLCEFRARLLAGEAKGLADRQRSDRHRARSPPRTGRPGRHLPARDPAQ
jgi:transposase